LVLASCSGSSEVRRMTPNMRKGLLEALAYASLILVLDLLVALVSFFVNPTVWVLYSASNFAILEFAILLILGGCLAAREPLDDQKKTDENGKPTKSWKAALLGRKMLATALFLLMYGALLVVLGPVG